MRIYKTKTGQPYIKLKSGKAKFIKRSSAKRIKSSLSSTKKSSRGQKMARKKKTYRRSTSMFGKLNTPVMGAAGVVAYESFISPMVPLQGIAKDIVELVGGLYLSKKRGFIGATGKTLVTINSYQLMSGLIGNKLKGVFGGNNNGNGYSYNDLSV